MTLHGREALPTPVTGRCEWFARCDNAAAGTVTHPILGEVPICERCAVKLGLVFTAPTP